MLIFFLEKQSIFFLITIKCKVRTKKYLRKRIKCSYSSALQVNFSVISPARLISCLDKLKFSLRCPWKESYPGWCRLQALCVWSTSSSGWSGCSTGQGPAVHRKKCSKVFEAGEEVCRPSESQEAVDQPSLAIVACEKIRCEIHNGWENTGAVFTWLHIL